MPPASASEPINRRVKLLVRCYLLKWSAVVVVTAVTGDVFDWRQLQLALLRNCQQQNLFLCLFVAICDADLATSSLLIRKTSRQRSSPITTQQQQQQQILCLSRARQHANT